MTKKVIRLITLVLAIARIASLAVGCGGDSNTPGGSGGKCEPPSLCDPIPSGSAAYDRGNADDP